MNRIVKNIPNSITCLNIIGGCIAIALACRGEERIGALTAMQWAYIAVGISAVADFCDGLSARLLHAYSAMGKELDSLCDLVSFGVAPAMMVYQTMLQSEETASMAWVAIVIAVCGALRLARFNVDDTQATIFTGLPIPANAIFWIGMTSILSANPAMLGVWPLVICIVTESWLMVSPFRMFSLKFKHLGWKGNEIRWILALTAVISVVTMGVGGLMWLIVAYFLLSRIPQAYK